MPIVFKSGSLNLLEPPEPVQACNGIALLFTADSESAHLGFEPFLRLILDISLVVLVNVTVLVSWGSSCVERLCVFCLSSHSTAAVHKYTCLHSGPLYVQLHGNS